MRRHKPISAGVLSFIFSMMMSPWSTSWATSFVHVPFPQTVEEAPHIVRGVTGKSQSDWAIGADGAKRLFTYTEFDVRESIKGGLPVRSKISIRALGGEKNGIGMQVSGSAQFVPGEDAVLFLGEKNADGTYDVKGMSMGKFTVATDSNGRETLVGLGAEAHLPEGTPDVPGASERKITLNELRDLVRTSSRESVNAAPSPEERTPVPSGTESVSLNQDPSKTAPMASPELIVPVQSKRGWPLALGLSAGALLAAGWFFFRRRN